MTDQHPRLLPHLSTGHPSKSAIMRSKREIEDMLNIARKSEPSANDVNSHCQCLFVNRQITSGGVLDWKEFKKDSQRQSEISIRDVEKGGDRPIFEMFIEEWKEGQPSKVIYKWIRRPRQAEGILAEEEHLYRGGVLNRHKHGEGEYLIIRRFNDSTETIKGIKGTWRFDVLENGLLTEETGQQHTITGSIFRDRSNRKIGGPEANKVSNKTIAMEARKLTGKRCSFRISSNNIDSKKSAVSIMYKEAERQERR